MKTRVNTFLLAGALCSWLVGGAAAGALKSRGPGDYPHMRQPVSIRTVDADLEPVLKWLHDKLGVELIVPSAVRLSKHSCVAKNVPASDILDAIARTDHGHWITVREGWALSVHPETQAYLPLTEDELYTRDQQAARALEQLTTEQYDLLARRRAYLTPDDLTPFQRQALAELARLMFHEYSDISPRALALDGVYLRASIAQNPRSINRKSLEVVFPQRNGQHEGYIYPSLPDESLPNGISPEAMAAPLPPWAPRLDAPPAAPAASPHLFDGPDFDQIPAADIPPLQSVAPAAATLGLNVVLASHVKRPLWTGSRPARRLNTRERLQLIEEVTGGAWRRVESVYALETDAKLEELAELVPAERKRWSQAAEALLSQRLGVRQRRELAAGSVLSAKDLTKPQREALSWVAALSFLTYADVGRKALSLSQVTVERATTKDRSDPLPRVRVRVPTRSGGSRVVAEAQLR